MSRQANSHRKASPRLAPLFFNRELSWIQFNFRVLEEAQRKDNPLLERLKFLAISESNLNEFFMVRVAGLKQVVASAVNEIQLDGKTAEQTLLEISSQIHRMVALQYQVFDEICRGLANHGLHILSKYDQLDVHEKRYVNDFFEREVFRILTPLAIDPAHPFPHIINGRLNQAITLKNRGGRGKAPDVYAIVEVPSVLPRFLELPANRRGTAGKRLIPLEEILKASAGLLFPGSVVKSVHGFTITRNSEISIDEVASDNLLSTIEEELKNRRWGEAVRLSYRSGMPESIREFLRVRLDLEPAELFERPGMLNLHDLMEIYHLELADQELRDVPFIPKNVVPVEKPEKVFSFIRKKDIMLHLPFDSFQTVINMLQFAAKDPKVLAIKQTLYRTSGDSPIVRALIEAAENGKQVTVLVELKARFDEERNIVWAKEMEKHGVHVVYGLVGLKIHGKMLQIVRREADGVRSYAHLSTGNYNPITAKHYTDLAIITANEELNDDVTNLFHALTGYSNMPKLKKLAAAPINLRETLAHLIEVEIANARQSKPARMQLKMNALVDADMIRLLYRASQAGVSIDLNVRGICCLVPGIAGLSENITVTSIVGRFLEHSRIFYFENGGQPRLFLSSADWMPRNLNRRMEVMFPVESPEHKARVISILAAVFRDNHNSRRLNADGSYTRIQPDKKHARFSSQRYFREETNREFAEKQRALGAERRSIFLPVTNSAVASGAAPDNDENDGMLDVSSEQGSV